MRPTTKITIGIFLSIYVLSILHIIYFSFTERKNYPDLINHSIRFSQEHTMGLNLPPCRVIVFEAEQFDPERACYYPLVSNESGVFIHPAATIDEDNKLYFPEELNDFISLQTKNDTLVVKIKMDGMAQRYGMMDVPLLKGRTTRSRHYVSVSGVNLYVHTSEVNIINKLGDIPIQVSRLETDTIKIYSMGGVAIDSCKAKVIDPVVESRYDGRFTMTNSATQALNLDLDKTRGWRTTNCNIEAINITGSGRNAGLNLYSNEYGTINWLPKNSDAELSIKIKGNPAKVIYQID